MFSCFAIDSSHDINFVSSQDVHSYLDKIHSTYHIVRTLSPVQLYEYFLQLEHDYIFNGTENFCALTHRLNPAAYSAYQEKLRNVNNNADDKRPGRKYSILQTLKCSNCRVPFPTLQAMQIHILGATVKCACGTDMNYENIAVQTYQETYNTNPTYMVPYFYHMGIQFPDRAPAKTFKGTWAYVHRHQWIKRGYVHWERSFNKVMGKLSWSGLDLILAMYRQIDFLVKVCQSEESFRYWKSADIIELSIIRYYKFVTLFGSNSRMPIVPTVDIDIVWHSHMAQANKYDLYFAKNFKKKKLGHDDTIDENSAHYGYGMTYRAWYRKFKEQYSIYRPADAAIWENNNFNRVPILPALLATPDAPDLIKMGTPVNIPLPIRSTIVTVPDPQNVTSFPAGYYQVLPFVYNGATRAKVALFAKKTIAAQEKFAGDRTLVRVRWRGGRGGGGCGGGDGGGGHGCGGHGCGGHGCGGGDGGGCGGGGCGGGGGD